MKRMLFIGFLFLLSGYCGQAQARLALNSYKKLKDSLSFYSVAVARLRPNTEQYRRRNDSLEAQLKADSGVFEMKKKLVRSWDSLQKLDDTFALLKGKTERLDGQLDSLATLRKDSGALVQGIVQFTEENLTLQNRIQGDSLAVVAALANIKASPELREKELWTRLDRESRLSEALGTARAVLSTGYDQPTCTTALHLLEYEDGGSFTGAAQDSLKKYRSLLLNYCAVNEGCFEVINRTLAEFSLDLPGEAAKDLAEKAKSVSDYPFLHQELLRLSVLAAHYKGSGEDFIRQSAILHTVCK